MIELKDTAVLMNSEDYKERFVAEYWQLKHRYERLRNMVVKYEAGVLEFKADCPLELLKEQMEAMGKYLYCLEVRARIEKTDLFYSRIKKYGRYFKREGRSTQEMIQFCRADARLFLEEKHRESEASLEGSERIQG